MIVLVKYGNQKVTTIISYMLTLFALFCFSFLELDIFPFLVTSVAGLILGLEYGMVCGILANMLFILYKSVRPKISISKVKIQNIQVGIVDVKENLCYPSAEYLKCKVIKFVVSNDDIKLIVLNGKEITNIDSTVALVSVKNKFSNMEFQPLVFLEYYIVEG